MGSDAVLSLRVCLLFPCLTRLDVVIIANVFVIHCLLRKLFVSLIKAAYYFYHVDCNCNRIQIESIIFTRHYTLHSSYSWYDCCYKRLV